MAEVGSTRQNVFSDSDPFSGLRTPFLGSAFGRGTLSASGHNGSSLDTISTPSATNSWTLDALGNWTATKNGSQTRTFNAQNQITGISGQGSTVYDNGDLVQDPSGNRSFYDAWNRMVYSDTQNYSYSSYDALGRKIHEGQNGLDLYYNTAGNVIEERSGSSVYRQYVWGLGYVNNLVLQDLQGTRYYVQQDSNWNVTSVTNASGSVVQRMVYDPYGAAVYLSPSWTSSYNAANLLYSFQGGRIEGSYIHFGARDYNPSLGVWMQPDPIGSADSEDLYQIEDGNPTSRQDPTGTSTRIPGPWHPPGGIKGCKPSDNCETLLEKIANLMTSITAHVNWDIDNPRPGYPSGRHSKDINDQIVALRRCNEIAGMKGCFKQPPPCTQPAPSPAPQPAPRPAPTPASPPQQQRPWPLKHGLPWWFPWWL